MDPPGDQAEVVAQHEQQEQGYRQAYAQGQGSCGALGLAAVVDQEKQRRAQAGEDQDDEENDDDISLQAAEEFCECIPVKLTLPEKQPSDARKPAFSSRLCARSGGAGRYRAHGVAGQLADASRRGKAGPGRATWMTLPAMSSWRCRRGRSMRMTTNSGASACAESIPQNTPSCSTTRCCTAASGTRC